MSTPGLQIHSDQIQNANKTSVSSDGVTLTIENLNLTKLTVNCEEIVMNLDTR